MGTWIQLISLSAGLLGLLLLLRGLLGRRVGTAPHCRNCRFDLTGLYPEHQVCPECGTELTGPRATTRGLRRRRWVVFALGVLLLAGAGTLGAMAARGGITKARIADMLPTRALIMLAVDHPNVWLANECADELLGRVTIGAFRPQAGLRLADSLVAALNRTDPAEYERFLDLLRSLSLSPSSPPEIGRRYTDFLLDRIVRTDLPWMSDWGFELLTLRGIGRIPDDRWNATVTELITPRLWCSSGEVVEPGEVFVIRTSYLAERLSFGAGIFLERRESAEGIRPPADLRDVFTSGRYGLGMPFVDKPLGELRVAQPELSSWELVVRAWYAEGMTELHGIKTSVGLNHPSTRSAETRLPLKIRPTAPEAASDPPSIKQWLRARLLPATPSWGGKLLAAPPPRFPCRIAVLASPGELALHGTLRAIARDGTITDEGTFDVLLKGENGRAVWTSRGLARSDSQTGTGGYGVTTLPEILLNLPAECLLPGARAVLLFDHVTLPDGRTFDAKESGAAPIEIEVPLDPDAGGFHW